MHLTALRNNRVWSTLKGQWTEAGSICGLITQRGDSSAWVNFYGETWCIFLVENGIAIAKEQHDNLMLAATFALPATCISGAVVSGGAFWFLVLADDGSAQLLSFNGEEIVAATVDDFQWPMVHAPPVLEPVGEVFFVCPTSVYLSSRASSMMHHGVISKTGRLVVPPVPVTPITPAQLVFCQTPKFTISTTGTLALIDGDTLDLRSLLTPVETPSVASGAVFDTEIQVGFELDRLLPTIIGGMVQCVAADGFTRQADVVGLTKTSNSLWLRLGRPLSVPEGALLKIYGGFGADAAPYQYQSGPDAGKWAPRGIVTRVAWVSVDDNLCVAVARPGEVVIVQIKGRRVIGAKCLGHCDPNLMQMVYDGSAAHVLDAQDRWGREHRLFPAAGAAVGVSIP